MKKRIDLTSQNARGYAEFHRVSSLNISTFNKLLPSIKQIEDLADYIEKKQQTVDDYAKYLFEEFGQEMGEKLLNHIKKLHNNGNYF